MNRKWEIKTINDIATSIGSGGLPTKSMAGAKGDVPVVGLKNVNKLKSPFIYTCNDYLDIDIREFKNKRVQK